MPKNQNYKLPVLETITNNLIQRQWHFFFWIRNDTTETSAGVLEDLDDEDVHEPHDHHNYIKIEPLYTTVSDK